MNMDLYLISLIMLLSFLFILMVFFTADYFTKTKLKGKPHISFIMSTYNDKDTLDESIGSVYASYDKNNFDLYVIDDKSTDGSLGFARKLKEKYGFILIENEKNVGRPNNVNNLVSKLKTEFIFVVDSDTVINKKAVEDVLSRLEKSRRVAAVSSLIIPKNKGLWARMQEIEYNMNFFIASSYNLFSCLNLCGAFVCFRREPFLKVGGFSPNAIIDDMDLALKLNEAGYKVKYAHKAVLTYVPIKMGDWYKQKIRWISGVMQCFIRHIKTWITHPLHVGLILFYSIIIALSVYSLFTQMLFWDNIYKQFIFLAKTTTLLATCKWLGVVYSTTIFISLLEKLSFSFFSLPYVLLMIKKPKDVLKIFLCFPFSLIYFPLLIIVSIIGMFVMIFKYPQLRKGKRAW